MPRLIVSVDGVVLRDVVLRQGRTTLGRHPDNDVVLSDRAVSAKHAVFVRDYRVGVVEIEDLDSTNGTRVNGLRMHTQVLQSGDLIDVGSARICFLVDGDLAEPDGAMHGSKDAVELPGTNHAHGATADAAFDSGGAPVPALPGAGLKLISGYDESDLDLVKVVTTIGRLGVAVAAIIRRQQGYVIHKLDGNDEAFLNESPLSSNPQPLCHGDRVSLAGTVYEFILY